LGFFVPFQVVLNEFGAGAAQGDDEDQAQDIGNKEGDTVL